MISICRTHAGNVKRWRDGQMALRWCAAGMVEAGKQFRRGLRTCFEARKHREGKPDLVARFGGILWVPRTPVTASE